MADNRLDREIEEHVEALGYEFVDLEHAGSKSRPILRLRIDKPEAGPEQGKGVTVEDCARVSREVEAFLDARPELSERYTLEVSSPGVERPLTRRRDYERFVGREVAVTGHDPLVGRGRNLQGELLGIAGEGEGEQVRLRLTDGEVVEVPRAQIARAHLIFRWDEAGS